LGLLLWHRAVRVISMPDNGRIVAATLWAKVTRNELAVCCHLEQELYGNGTEKLSAIVISSVVVTFLYPRNAGCFARETITEHNST
jgi:hypothetical protein